MWPCGIMVMLTELFSAESKSQVYAALHELLSKCSKISTTLSKCLCSACFLLMLVVLWCCSVCTMVWPWYVSTIYPEFVCYDDGCHLRKYAKHPSRSLLTPQSTKLANTEIVIDKMHMAGHTDVWCHQHCDPKSFKELENVSVQVADYCCS